MQVDSKGDRKRLSWWYESLKGIFRPSFILSTSLHPVQLPYFSFSVSLYLITSCLSPTIPFLFLSSFTKHIVCFSVFTSLSGLFFLRRLPLVLSFFFFLFLFVPVVPCSCPVVGQGGGGGGGGGGGRKRMLILPPQWQVRKKGQNTREVSPVRGNEMAAALFACVGPYLCDQKRSGLQFEWHFVLLFIYFSTLSCWANGTYVCRCVFCVERANANVFVCVHSFVEVISFFYPPVQELFSIPSLFFKSVICLPLSASHTFSQFCFSLSLSLSLFTPHSCRKCNHVLCCGEG